MITKVLSNEITLTEITLKYLSESDSIGPCSADYFAKKFFEAYNQISNRLSELQSEETNKNWNIK